MNRHRHRRRSFVFSCAVVGLVGGVGACCGCCCCILSDVFGGCIGGGVNDCGGAGGCGVDVGEGVRWIDVGVGVSIVGVLGGERAVVVHCCVCESTVTSIVSSLRSLCRFVGAGAL